MTMPRGRGEGCPKSASTEEGLLGGPARPHRGRLAVEQCRSRVMSFVVGAEGRHSDALEARSLECRKLSQSCPCPSTATSPIPSGGVAEVFDWYVNSGDVEIHTGGSDPMTFRVSEPSAEHLRGLTSELGAMLTGRRTFDAAEGWGGNHAWGPAFVLTHRHPRGLAATRLDRPLRDRRHRERRAPGQGRRRREVRGGPRRRHHPAVPECRAPRRDLTSTSQRSFSAPEFRLFDRLAGTPTELDNPTVIAGVGVTHLRYPVRKA